MTLSFPNPDAPYPCIPTAIRVELITSGANLTVNVILYFSGREIRWSKYYPGVTTLFDCFLNVEEMIPFLLKSPGLSVGFDNSPVRLSAL